MTTYDDLLAGLEETRAEHYGAGYFDRLREMAAARDAADER